MSVPFASDNYAGVHPAIMSAILQANEGFTGSYGNDEFTKRAVQQFKKYFGEDISVHFVFNGTGANVLGISAVTQSFNSILCSETAHIFVDESTAPETFTNCRLVPLSHKHGKVLPEIVEKHIIRQGDMHHPQAKLLSISQSTEYGTVYTIEEIKTLSKVLKKYGLLFHMDGSRIANAAVSLGCEFREFTKDAGIDILSFGGTKNGMMFGEAVVFFNPELAQTIAFKHKQSMQLASKMRFIAAQFEAMLTGDLWKYNATHANRMTKLLYDTIKDIPQIQITQPVEANSIFAIVPPDWIEELQKTNYFYVWNEHISEVRWMCAFNTPQEEVLHFAEVIRKLSNS
jgi:threonine aldolase